VSEAKYCRDCKHYGPIGAPIRPACWTPSRGLSRVTGQPDAVDPGMARSNELDCGPGAVWFELHEAPKKPGKLVVKPPRPNVSAGGGGAWVFLAALAWLPVAMWAKWMGWW
jgi:hypothetical protein